MSVSTRLKAVVRLEGSRVVDLIEAYNNLWNLGIDAPEELLEEIDQAGIEYYGGEKIDIDGPYISTWLEESDVKISVGVEDYETTQLYALKDLPKGTEYVVITITAQLIYFAIFPEKIS